MINEFRPMNHLTSLQNFICTIGNLPSSYALSLSYEEQIWWLCDFLEKKIFPAIEENTNITEETQQEFIELQQYVTDYFNNLDVQEEINNKLDEMVESGTLQSIIETYITNKMTRTYSTLNDMCEDTSLTDGMCAKILGYHSSNDGAFAEYVISNDNSLTADNGSVISLNNGLKAILLIKDNLINPKQFGAYGDGIHDDTNAFKNAINFIKSKFTYNDMSKAFMLYLTAGNYIITETLNIPFYIKIKFTGHVLILSNVSNNPTIHYISDSFIPPSSNLDNIAQSIYKDGKLISGNGILMIQRNNNRQDINNLNSTSIGIEFGDRTVITGALQFAGVDIENISVRDFAIGIKLNSINTYLLRFNSITLGRNRINFQYGENNGTITNTGENIVFTNSGFAHSYNAFINYAGGQFSFEGCSFDFNGNDILLKKASNLSLEHCHFEGEGFSQQGFTEADINNTEGFGTIIYNNFVPTSRF